MSAMQLKTSGFPGSIFSMLVYFKTEDAAIEKI